MRSIVIFRQRNYIDGKYKIAKPKSICLFEKNI